MEFKELKQQVNNIGLEITRDENSTCIFNDKIACSISEKVVGVMSTDYSSFWALPIMIRKQLMTMLCNYSSTELSERHIKRYYLQHKFLKNSAGHSFLNVSEDFTKMSLGTKREYKNKRNQVLFTEKELDVLKFKLKSNLEDFTLIEQKEETSQYKIN